MVKWETYFNANDILDKYNSRFIESASNSFQISSEDLMPMLINLMEKKDSFILKCYDNHLAFKRLDKQSQSLLIMKYKDKLSIEQIMNKFNCSARTIFRKLLVIDKKCCNFWGIDYKTLGTWECKNNGDCYFRFKHKDNRIKKTTTKK